MADTKKMPPAKYSVSEDTKKVIADYARLSADAHCAKCRFENPKIKPAEIARLWAVEHKKASAAMTKEVNDTRAAINTFVTETRKEGKIPGIEIGAHTVRIIEQKNMDEALQLVVTTGDMPDLKRQKAYYEGHFALRNKLKSREEGIRNGTATRFGDLELVRILDENRDLKDMGSALGIPARQLQIDAYQYELRIMESRIDPKEKNHRREDDTKRVDLVKSWLREEETAYALERKKEAEKKLLPPPTVVIERSSEGTPAPPLPSGTPGVIPERLPETVPDILPPPREKKAAPKSFVEAAEEIARIFEGRSGFKSDFTTPAAKGVAAEKSRAG